jgi:hypothetical protein
MGLYMLLTIKRNNLICLNYDKSFVEILYNCVGKNVLKLAEEAHNNQEMLIKFLFEEKVYWSSEFSFSDNQQINKILGENLSVRPGICILEFMQDENKDKKFVCDMLNLSLEELNLLIIGFFEINECLAKKLSKLFNKHKDFRSKKFWIDIEKNYRQNLQSLK